MASDLKKELLELLERDREFRLSVAGLLGYKEILEELKRLREDMHRGFEEHSRRFDENDRKFNEILERLDRHEAHLTEHDRKFNEILERLDRHEEEIKALREDFLNFQRNMDTFQRRMDSFEETQKAFQRRLDALGARWGILSEDAFRGSMWGIVERLFGGSVEHWIYEDSEGFVFGYPATIEVDLIIKDKEHILVEIKSHVRKSDVGVLLRKGKLYKRVRGITPRLVFVSPYIDEDARSDAEMLGIEAYNA
ncbi:MAG: DUF3782 domain-containing protein [Candidatus Methanospirare jalkutatii]|nr:DUF3782 domain-containing protein [Candidatus Methanospirare jalkutatii]